MRKLLTIALAGLTLAGAGTAAQAAVQSPAKLIPAIAYSGDAGLQTVQYYGDRRSYRQGRRDARRYYNNQRRYDRYYDRGYYRRGRGNDAAAAAVVGGVLGYALGAATAPNYYGNSYSRGFYAPQPHYYVPRYCSDYYGRTYAC